MLVTKRIALLIATLGLGLVWACNRPPRPFQLPDGDAGEGRLAFVRLGCHTCHRVHADPEIPKPVAHPPVRVLGVGYKRAPSDAELFTSIINPSHDIKTPYHDQKSADPTGRWSRMGDFTGTMTVEQAVDIVAYLRTRYELGTDPDQSKSAPVGPLPEAVLREIGALEEKKEAPAEDKPQPGEESHDR